MRHALVAAVILAAVSVRAQLAAPQPAVNRAPAPNQSPVKGDLERGYRLKEQHKTAEAISAFGAVLKKDPENHAAVTELAYLNAGAKKWNSAAKWFEKAVAQDGENGRLRMDYGYALQALKKPAEAAAQFQAAADKPGEFQEAAKAALAAVGTAPAAVDAETQKLKERGYALLKKGDLEGAARVFEGVRAKSPEDFVVALQLGYTYDKLQKKDLAREAFTAALGSGDAKIHDAAQSALEASGGAAAVPTQQPL